MTDAGKRLDKLFPSLTAQERAILVLRAWKEGRDEDPQVRRTMPDWQVREFNRLINLMNGVNVRLGQYVLVVELLVRELEMRLQWLVSAWLWGQHSSELIEYLVLHTKEPVAASEYAGLLEEARREMAPVNELAEFLVETHNGWAPEDLEDIGDNRVKDSAWERLFGEKRQELMGLVKDGVLAGKRKGRGTLINVGCFYDWLGKPCPVPAEWGSAYEVYPDDQVEEVERMRQARQVVRDTLLRTVDVVSLGWDSIPEMPGEKVEGKKRPRGQVTLALKDTVRKGIEMRWMELRAVEVIVEEVAREFSGEDPAVPRLRQTIEETKGQVKRVQEGMMAFGEHVELPEPSEEVLTQARLAFERDS